MHLQSSDDLYAELRIAVQSTDLSQRTQQNYLHWAARFLSFHHQKSLEDLNQADFQAFLRFLINRLKASPARYKQALVAIRFMYLHVLQKPLPDNLPKDSGTPQNRSMRFR